METAGLEVEGVDSAGGKNVFLKESSDCEEIMDVDVQITDPSDIEEDDTKAMFEFKQELDKGGIKKETVQTNLNRGNGEAMLDVLKAKMEAVELATSPQLQRRQRGGKQKRPLCQEIRKDKILYCV